MSATVRELGPLDAEGLRALLTRDTPHNLYLLGIFEEFGIVPRPGRRAFTFYGGFKYTGEMAAVLFVGGEGGLVIPSSSEPSDVIPIAESLSGKVQMKACMGDAAAADAVARLLAPTRPRTSLSQRLYRVTADDLGPFTNPTLRLAEESDLPKLVPLAASFVKEIFGRDPLAEDPDAYRARVLQRIRGRRTYVLELEGRLVFKIDIGSRSQHGAELEALYTIPEERGRGHASLSLGQISRHLLSSIPRLTLRIDDTKPGLAKIARKVGFIPGKPQRLIVVE